MRVAFSNVLAVFWQVRLKNAHCKKLPDPQTLQPDDLDWLKAATMGNQMDNHIYVADWTGIPVIFISSELFFFISDFAQFITIIC